MNRRRRRSITFGVLLILIGGWFLAVELIEPLNNWANAFAEWPMWIVAVGVLFLIAALVGGTPGLAVPAAVISGIGGILYYQNATGEWGTWAYAWALIPGFVSVGVAIQYLLNGNFRQALREGGGGILASLIMFGVFGAFLHPFVGGPEFMGQLSAYWPVLLIFLGLWILVKPIFKRRRRVEADVV